jgi:hypothetical protein
MNICVDCTQSMSSLAFFFIYFISLDLFVIFFIRCDSSSYRFMKICRNLSRFTDIMFTCFAFCLRLCHAFGFDCVLSDIARNQQSVRCWYCCISLQFMQSHCSLHFLWHDLFPLCGTGYRKHSQTPDGSWIWVWVQGSNVCQRQRHAHHILRKNAIWRKVDGFKDKQRHLPMAHGACWVKYCIIPQTDEEMCFQFLATFFRFGKLW